MTKQILFISFVILGLVQFSFGQKMVSPNKQKLVSGLIETTKQVFPFEQYEAGFQKARELIRADFENGISEKLKQKIDSTEVFTADEKEKLKAKTPEFAQEYANFIDNLMSRDFRMKIWVNESAATHFNQKYSMAELQKLNKFLQSPNGQKTILAMRNLFAKEFKGENPETNSAKAEEFEKIAEKFAGTQMGEKFLSIVVENVLGDIQKKVDIWEAQVFGNFDSFINEKEFNNLLGNFLKRTLET